MTKNLKILLGLLLLFQLGIITFSGPAHDETYYWLFSDNLDWGFFDHPPMVAVVIKLFSFLPHSTLALRLGFLLMQFGCLYFLLRLIPKSTWTQAVLLFFAFPLASFSGNFALPDMPLLFFSTAYIFFLKFFLDRPSKLSSINLGIIIGLLLYSKYHGILLIFFTILALPRLVLNKYFYLVALIALLLFTPHIWWQYEHGFATLRYHFLERPSSSFSFSRILEYLSVQIGLAGVLCGPFIWYTIIRKKCDETFSRVMKFIVVGVVTFFFLSTFSKKFEANWTVFITPSFIYLVCLSGLIEKKSFNFLLMTSFLIVILVRSLLVLPANSFSLKRLGEFQGWEKFSQEVKAKCRGPILANTYQIASKLSFYLHEPIHSLNYHSRKNQFDFWYPHENYYRSSSLCYVTDKKHFGGEVILTPEQKRLFLIRQFSPSELSRP